MELTRRGLSGLLAGLTAKVMTPGHALAKEAISVADKTYALKASQVMGSHLNQANSPIYDPVKQAALKIVEDHFRSRRQMQPVAEREFYRYGSEFRSMSPAARRTFGNLAEREQREEWRLYDLARRHIIGEEFDNGPVPSMGYRSG